MRKLICLSILFITLSFLLPGCRKETKRLAPFGWEAIGEPMDSLVLELQWFLCRNRMDYTGPDDSVARRLEVLREAAAHPKAHPEAKARVKFFEAIHKSRKFKSDTLYAAAFNEAKTLSDSLHYPFLTRRVNLLIWLKPPITYDKRLYENLDKATRYISESCDTFVLAQTLLCKAHFYAVIRDLDMATSTAMKADSLYMHLGLTGYSYECKSLIIGFALRSEDFSKADTLARWMEMHDNQAIFSLRALFYLNRYSQLSHDESDLMLARKLSVRDTLTPYGRLAAAPVFLVSAMNSAEHGNFATAAVYDSIGMHFLGKTDPSVYLDFSPVFRQRAKYLEIIGERDSAYNWLSHALDVNEQLMQSKDFSGALKSAIKQYQAEKEIEEQRASSRRTLWLVLAGAVLIILFGTGAVIYWRRRQQRKLKSVQEQLRFEEAQRKVLAMEIAIEEGQALLGNIGREMSQMASEGHLSAEGAARLRSSIKVHTGAGEERENFIETFTKLHPEFATRLKEIAPTMTDSDIRMASYVALGLDTRHISRILSIRPESVKQARWRLRQKLNLASGASLDTYLADLLK